MKRVWLGALISGLAVVAVMGCKGGAQIYQVKEAPVQTATGKVPSIEQVQKTIIESGVKLGQVADNFVNQKGVIVRISYYRDFFFGCRTHRSAGKIHRVLCEVSGKIKQWPELVPLISMSNTVFAEGDSRSEDLIADVDDGYYIVGHAIPSIAESRENFSISARKVFKIENGEPTTLYKKGGMSADSGDYFMAVDGVGKDFCLFPIPNCGKGQPMQVKKLGNGGPTLRSRARITGGAK